MIKIEIGKCIEPYNRFFNKGDLYLIIPTKGAQGIKAAYISPTQGFPIISTRIAYYRGEYHHMFFEPIETILFRNYKELKKFKESIFRYNCIHVPDLLKEKLNTNLILLPKVKPEYIHVIDRHTTDYINFYFNGEKIEK
jgi:hypothetical protein